MAQKKSFGIPPAEDREGKNFEEIEVCGRDIKIYEPSDGAVLQFSRIKARRANIGDQMGYLLAFIGHVSSDDDTDFIEDMIGDGNLRFPEDVEAIISTAIDLYTEDPTRGSGGSSNPSAGKPGRSSTGGARQRASSQKP